MPAGRGAVSPIRRPRAFARALGAMAAEQAGPRGRIVLLRSTVEDRTFCTAHKSQTVYHGPVVYLDDPVRRLEAARSDLELLLLLVFVKNAAHRDQREYRFAVWAEADPAEDVLDLDVSPALADAMSNPRPEPEGSGFMPAGGEEYSAVEDGDDDGPSRARARVETLPVFPGAGNPTMVPLHHDAETLPSDLRETAAARAAVEVLREAAERAGGVKAAAAAWHAEPVVWFLCTALDCRIAGMRVNEDGFIVVTAELTGNGPVETRIVVGPDGTCACGISSGDTHLGATALDGRAFEQVLRERLVEVGVRGHVPDS